MAPLPEMTLLINLDRDEARLHRVAAQLDAAHLPWRRLPAMLGSEVPPNLVTPACQALCTPAMRGCMASHRKAWAEIVSHGYESALILEDDAIVPPDTLARLAAVGPELPPGWDLLCLGRHNHARNGFYIDRVLEALVSSATDAPVSRNLLSLGLMTGTFAYALSSAGAKKLVAMLSKASYHVDMAMSAKMTQLSAYAVAEPIIMHDYSTSNLGSAVPHIPNMLTTFTIGSDSRPVSWFLSEPWLNIPILEYPLNGWLFAFLCLILLLRPPVAVVLLLLLFDWSLGTSPSPTTAPTPSSHSSSSSSRCTRARGASQFAKCPPASPARWPHSPLRSPGPAPPPYCPSLRILNLKSKLEAEPKLLKQLPPPRHSADLLACTICPICAAPATASGPSSSCSTRHRASKTVSSPRVPPSTVAPTASSCRV